MDAGTASSSSAPVETYQHVKNELLQLVEGDVDDENRQRLKPTSETRQRDANDRNRFSSIGARPNRPTPVTSTQRSKH